MSILQHQTTEQLRLELQATLDSAKSLSDRNKLGQFATPSALASDMIRFAMSLLSKRMLVRFLDPAFGTGAFYSALLSALPQTRIAWAKGYEIDPHFGKPAKELWADTPLNLVLGDFTTAEPPRRDEDKANLIICNPPYVRHHHLGPSSKQRLRLTALRASDVDLNGLSGLYCHFLAISHAWMAKNALAVWLVPSEFMDVNYGQPIKEYLGNRVTLLRIHRFDALDVQFSDALVSSAVVCFRNAEPPSDHLVEFTYGGTLSRPKRTRTLEARRLEPDAKWTHHALASKPRECVERKVKLSDLLVIKRGIATGANHFFVIPEAKARELGLPDRFLKPILPSPRFLKTDEIEADTQGGPLIEPRLVLLDCKLPEEEVRRKHPSLWAYLESGRAQGIHDRYLSRHKQPWYAQEHREPAPLLCTYMGRNLRDRGAFRFILNHSRAIAANVYLMLYPKPPLTRCIQHDPERLRTVWEALNLIPWETLIGVGRVYGGGLHKMEPKELAQAPAYTLLEAMPEISVPIQAQLNL